VPLDGLPSAARRPAGCVLALLRLLKPWHLAHGYGVFAPIALRLFAGERLVMRLYAQIEEREDAPAHSSDDEAMQRWLHVEAFVADGPPQKVEPTDRGAESTPPGKPRRRWIALPTRYNSVAGGGRLQFFAPHQPRLDHQLYYEAIEINLAATIL
jgi:hypothetical protein